MLWPQLQRYQRYLTILLPPFVDPLSPPPISPMVVVVPLCTSSSDFRCFLSLLILCVSSIIQIKIVNLGRCCTCLS
ncbi:hypothetical protein HanIR_Chr11g0502881 [Helianthus annuus]|nr:hypothetical protein HanIR_Chr11g0502881 [Helianthus annuus]